MALFQIREDPGFIGQHERQPDMRRLGLHEGNEIGRQRAGCEPGDLRGGSPEENAAAIRSVFAGENGGRRSAILLNAAGAIAAGGHAEDLSEGLELARAAVDSGAAAARLDELAAFSQSEGGAT